MKNKVTDELKQHFRPEFLNRVDDTIVFPQLTQDEIVEIVDLMIAKLDERLRDKDMGIELTTAAKALLAKKGYDPVLGARPLRRAIQREIEDALSEKILFGELKAGEIVAGGHRGRGQGGGLHLPWQPQGEPAGHPADRGGHLHGVTSGGHRDGVGCAPAHPTFSPLRHPVRRCGRGRAGPLGRPTPDWGQGRGVS